MKKILITGMTPKQVGRNRSDWVTFVDALKLMIEASGDYEIDHRPVIPGENLSAYDKVFVFIAPHDSIAAGYRWGGLYTLATRSDAVVAVDDWQYYTIQMKMSSALTAGRFYRFVDAMPDWSRKEEVQGLLDNPSAKKAIEELARDMSWDMPFKKILMPLFKWYNPDKIGFRIKDKSKIIPVDPSRFIQLPLFGTSSKEKRWVMGSLFDHSDYLEKLNLSWPVLKYGHKKTQTVLTEDKLCEVYSKSLGIISPKYKTSGDGWWRMRYLHAATYKNILLMSPQEAENMGESFKVSGHFIECMHVPSLLSILKTQNAWLKENFESVESVLNKTMGVLK